MTSPVALLSQQGFYDLPPGMLATIVTHLEMRAPPPHASPTGHPEAELSHCRPISVEDYRTIYQRVGQDWLWFSRMIESDDSLERIVQNDLVDIYQVVVSGQAEGLLELDYRVEGECEIAFFGLSAAHTGRGLGSWLMSNAIAIAWSRPISRLWVHTCTFDHPKALAFYQKQGFKPFKQEIELVSDPRLDGTLPISAARHIPMIADLPR